MRRALVFACLLGLSALAAPGCFEGTVAVNVDGFMPNPRSTEEKENDSLRRDIDKAKAREKQLRREISDLEKAL
jgi:cell division protein FtsB